MTAPPTAAPTGGETGRLGGGRRVAVWLLHGYQVARSGHVSPCRFTPTCSEYAVQAVSTHGVWRGTALSARRLTRCRPGGPFGYDPVPPVDPSDRAGRTHPCPTHPPVPE